MFDVRTRMIRLALTVLFMSFGTTTAALAQASFKPLGFLPGNNDSVAYAISADGSVIVGRSDSNGPTQAVAWDRKGTITSLGDLQNGSRNNYALGASGNGAVIVGMAYTSQGYEGFRWTSSEGMKGLGDLSGGDFAGWARGSSADGSVIVGYGTSSFGTEATRWTAATGVQTLGSNTFSAASCSSDGAVVTGVFRTGGGFVWTGGTGAIAIGDPIGGSNNGTNPVKMSADGTTIVGYAYFPTNLYGYGRRPFRWTKETGSVELGGEGHATGVSADGSVIVGFGEGAWGGEGGFIWDASEGMQDLKLLLESKGLNLDGWQLWPYDVSSDGSVIVGAGIHNGTQEAWVAVVPEPATMSLLALGGMAMIRRRRK